MFVTTASESERGTSPARFATIATLSLASLVLIIFTGAAVRLTGSGLGCSDWPTCTDDRLVPAAEFHGLVEFLNRVFSGIVAVATIGTLISAHRRYPYRRDFVTISWAVVGLVVAQVVIGGITVLTHLRPEVVMVHFLLSIALVALAVVLVVRARLDANGTADAPVGDRVRRMSMVLACWTAVVVFAGTVVTAAGPHAGDENVERLGIAVRTAARTHAALVWILLGLIVATFIVFDRAGIDGEHRVRRHLHAFVAVVAAQGTIGYVQYFVDTPATLVGIHIAGATAVWITAVRLAMHPAAANDETKAAEQELVA